MKAKCLFVLLLSSAFLLVRARGDDQKPPAEEKVATLEIGARAPDFDLPGVDGKSHKLEEYAAAKVLVIVFTCNHCPTAIQYQERLKKLTADFKEKGVAVVAIQPNDPEAIRPDELGYTDLSDSFPEMKKRAKDKAFNFPYLYDGSTQKVSRAYGPVATPHLFIFGPDRKLAYAGRIDDSEREDKVEKRDAREAIESILAGKPVAQPRTRAFGCSIKWSWKKATKSS
jgi:peroxiredoxin